uniref:Vasorin n=1 Tax=Pogona vitticeps TaxID=103695 RepID=A0ABM5EZU1_9SAUR
MGCPTLWGRLLLLPLLLPLLLLFPACAFAQGCPAECQCNPAQMVFCISRRTHAVPQGLPPDTANLYLFENGIRSLSEDSFVGLPALHLLDLSQNEIASLPHHVFQPLPGLRNLDLSSNQLRRITNESFRGLHQLERLYLHRNQIQHIHPAAFEALPNLLELKLQANQLQAVPPLHLPALLLLDLSWNRIGALEPGTFQVPNLESLKIAGLGLHRLEEELISDLQNLHELDLSDNLLAAVPSVLPRLRSLTKLSLAGNAHISQLLPGDFGALRNLQELDISKLNLHSLPEGFFGAFPRLKAVTAAENPFNCICPLSWLIAWASAGKASLRRSKETRCHFPPKNAGKMLLHLEYADFGCPATTTVTPTVKATSPKLATPAPSSEQASPEPSTPSRVPPGESSPTATPFTFLQFLPRPGRYLCPPHTCLNGGVCQLDAQNHLECVCPLGFSGLFCETQGPVTTAASLTQPPTPPDPVVVKHVGGTSLKVDLQNYVRSKSPLRGLRLTYWNLSGPDKRPVTLSLPASLPEYTVRALKPNSSYRICIGPLGDKAHEEDLCVEAQTAQATQQQQQHHAPVTQGPEASLTLVVVPAVAALLLLVAGVAIVSCYVWRRRRQRRQRKAPGPSPLPPPASVARGPDPLELEGVKACLEKGDAAGPAQKTAAEGAPNGLECEVPLMQPPFPGSTTPRLALPSYF